MIFLHFIWNQDKNKLWTVWHHHATWSICPPLFYISHMFLQQITKWDKEATGSTRERLSWEDENQTHKSRDFDPAAQTNGWWGFCNWCSSWGNMIRVEQAEVRGVGLKLSQPHRQWTTTVSATLVYSVLTGSSFSEQWGRFFSSKNVPACY